MAETEVGGHKYRVAGKMNTFVAFDVRRLYTPIVVAPSIGLPKKSMDEKPEDYRERTMEHMAQCLDRAWADLPKEHSDFILDACLPLVQRCALVNGQEVWTKVYPARFTLSFQDINEEHLLKLVQMVITECLQPFFRLPDAPGDTGATRE